jgi:hypothetical protein
MNKVEGSGRVDGGASKRTHLLVRAAWVHPGRRQHPMSGVCHLLHAPAAALSRASAVGRNGKRIGSVVLSDCTRVAVAVVAVMVAVVEVVVVVVGDGRSGGGGGGG